MGYRTQTIQIGAGSVTVRESRGLDLIDASGVYPKLQYRRTSKRELNRAQRFSNAFIRSEVAGDIGFPFADFDAPDAEVQATFEGWQALSSDDMAAWEVALNAVNQAVTDPNESASMEPEKTTTTGA